MLSAANFVALSRVTSERAPALNEMEISRACKRNPTCLRECDDLLRFGVCAEPWRRAGRALRKWPFCYRLFRVFDNGRLRALIMGLAMACGERVYLKAVKGWEFPERAVHQ